VIDDAPSFGEAATQVVSDVTRHGAEHAGSTLSSGDRSRLLHHNDGATRRLIFSAALLSIAAVLAGFAALPSIQTRLATAPFRYANLPFPLAAAGPFHAGDVVPLLIDRCVDDPSASQGDRAGYDIARALVADDERARAWTGAEGRVVLAPTFTDTPGQGCSGPIAMYLHRIPKDAAPGRYHFEGLARYVSRTGRASNAYWWSEPFDVVPLAGGTV
jgi:hypothetical protein